MAQFANSPQRDWRSYLSALLLLCSIAQAFAGTEQGFKASNPLAGRPPQGQAADAVPSCNDPRWRSAEMRKLLAPVVRRAEALLDVPLPDWDERAYLEYSRSGRREEGERMMRTRLYALGPLVLAECVEQAGRFVRGIERSLDGLALQPAWALPAHDPDLADLRGQPIVELHGCEAAHDLAWALRLTGERLDEGVRKRAIDAVERRIFAPMRRTLETRRSGGSLEKHWWLEGRSNWNAVCLSGILGAAYALDHGELSDWVDVARRYVQHYLHSVRDDGYSDEGPAYWNYGFGAYLRLRETLRWADPGGRDLMEDAKAQAMAAYPTGIEMTQGVVAPFGDAPFGTVIDKVKRAHAEAALGWTDLQDWQTVARPGATGARLNEAVWRLWGNPPPAITTKSRSVRASCSFFAESGVAVFRPAPGADLDRALTVSVRAGGARAHAHDDAGSYAIAMGRLLVAGDPGGPLYTRETFSANRRRNPMINSFGHPVPVVGGVRQRDATTSMAVWSGQPCEEAQERPSPELDLKPVYSVPGLNQLTRAFEYERHGAAVTVSDRFVAARPIQFETAFVTRGAVKAIHGGFEIAVGAAVAFVDVLATEPLETSIDLIDVDSSNQFSRVALKLRKPVRSGCIVHRFRAAPASPERPVDRVPSCLY